MTTPRAVIRSAIRIAKDGQFHVVVLDVEWLPGMLIISQYLTKKEAAAHRKVLVDSLTRLALPTEETKK